MKTTFISTVFNEEDSIKNFLDSILIQSKKPDEVIIVDGESRDNTVALIEKKAPEFIKRKIAFSLIVKKGNRSVGRNEAIKRAKENIILISDAGCILEKDWIRNISGPLEDEKVEVVAGYYKAKSKNNFQKSLSPYVLVMEDKINPENFLPATRSMAIRKSVWQESGGFLEKYSNNEDYVFSKKLKKDGKRIKFIKDAIVFWEPRRSLLDAFNMFYRFALGDAESGILRPKVLLIFLRYLLLLVIVIAYLLNPINQIPIAILILFMFYIGWAISKNYKYVNHSSALLYLPAIQFTSDFAVLLGTSRGLIERVGKRG